MPGMIENAMPFRTLADALVVRNHLIHALKEADVEDDPELQRKLLTFVVGGGGFSGVEAIAGLNDFIHEVKGNYPKTDFERLGENVPAFAQVFREKARKCGAA